MSPALALLLAVALGAETRVDVGVRTEVRVRRLDPAPTPAERDAIDLSASPHLTLGVTGGLGSLSATYAPRFTAADLGPDLRWEHMHEGELRLRLASGPAWSVDGFATAGIGRTDLITENRSAGGVTGPGTSTIATVNTVDLERQRAGLSLRLAPARRTEFLLSSAVSEDGGNDAVSRTVLPVARSAEASAELRWSATRLDQLGLRLAAARTRIAAIPADSGWASAMGTWRRHLTPQVELWSGAGAVALQSRVPGPPPSTERETHRRVSPAAELGLSRTAAPRGPGSEPAPAGARGPAALEGISGQVVATVGASVDRVSGAATPQLEVRGELRRPVATSVTAVGSGTGALTWPDTGRTRRGQLELGASWRLSPRAQVELGAYGAWQNSDDPSVPDVAEYGAFLRLGLDAPPLTR